MTEIDADRPSYTNDRAQAWGPQAREAMARDACNAWLNAPGSIGCSRRAELRQRGPRG